MPIFEYRCTECGHISSFLQKSADRKEHECQKCGSKDTVKVFSTFSAKSGGAPSGDSSCPTGTCPLS